MKIFVILVLFIFLLLKGCKAGADIIFLVDNSGSVGSSNFNTTLMFISNIVNGLNIGKEKDKFQLGVLTFHTPVKAEFNLDEYQDKKDIQKAIMEITYEGGGTNTGGAIKYLHTTAFSRTSGIVAFSKQTMILIIFKMIV